MEPNRMQQIRMDIVARWEGVNLWASEQSKLAPMNLSPQFIKYLLAKGFIL